MGEYLLDTPMISIEMGGVDVVLKVHLLQSLGTLALNFQYSFMISSSKGKEIEVAKSSNYWVPHQMEEPTSGRGNMGRWFLHAYTPVVVKCWGQHLFEGEGHVNP
jgi:hypothetical protein